MTVKLEVSKRVGSSAAVRSKGGIPAVVYGPKQEPVSIAVDKVLFEKTLKETGESTVLMLSGIDKEIEVLIHEVAFNAQKGGIEHIDFYAIEKGKEITVDVPLEFEGEAPALKLGGSLTTVLHEVEVVCQPSDLPKHIRVDLSSLVDLTSAIHIRDLVVPHGVTIENNEDEVVVLVQETEEEPVEEAPATDIAAVEVQEKGKTEEKAAQ